jgi:hypothetical protein
LTRYKGEGPETLQTLNKIEVRYNTRKNAPEYPAVKSLYKWRNVFGYRLGGILRQAVVKLAEAPRHFVNAYNFQKAGFGTRKDIMDARTLEKGGTLSEKRKKDAATRTTFEDYQRMYSTRDLIAAMKKENGNMGALPYMKYMKWNEFSERRHATAETNDYSVRKLVTDGIRALHDRSESEKIVDTSIKYEVDKDGFYILDEDTKKQLQGDSDKEVKIKAGNGKGWMTEEQIKNYNDIGKSQKSAGGQVKRFVKGALHIEDIKTGLERFKFRMKLRGNNLSEAWGDAKELKKSRPQRLLDAKIEGNAHVVKAIKKESALKTFFQSFYTSVKENDTRFRLKFDHLGMSETAPLDPNVTKTLENMKFGRGGEKNAVKTPQQD